MSVHHLLCILTCLWTSSCYLLILLSAIFIKADQNMLYIAGFFPTSSKIPEGAIGRGVLPAVYLALNHINQNVPSAVLHGYKLDLVWNDTQVFF